MRPFAQAGFYLKNIDQYFTLFNVCRKAANRGSEFPNTPFVLFFLQGMFDSLNKLHDRVNDLVKVLVYENQLKRLLDDKTLNDRQYAIASHILSSGEAVQLRALRQSPWYVALYSRLTDKTRRRDLKRLIDLKLISQDEQKSLWPYL